MLRGSVGLALAGLSLATGACSDPTPSPTPGKCPNGSEACAAGSGNALSVGDAANGSVTPFTSGQNVQIIHGPQGGQHFWVTAALSVEQEGSWTESFVFTAQDGSEAGQNTRKITVCNCPTLTQNIPVFLEHDLELTGTLSASATGPGGATAQAPDVVLSVKEVL